MRREGVRVEYPKAVGVAVLADGDTIPVSRLSELGADQTRRDNAHLTLTKA